MLSCAHVSATHTLCCAEDAASDPALHAVQACQWCVCACQQIACGSDHTLAVCQDGHAYGFGDNSLGQLGSPATQSPAKDLDPQLSIIKDEDGADLVFSKVCLLVWCMGRMLELWHFLLHHVASPCIFSMPFLAVMLMHALGCRPVCNNLLMACILEWDWPRLLAVGCCGPCPILLCAPLFAPTCVC